VQIVVGNIEITVITYYTWPTAWAANIAS